ncbi:FAD-dependent pyridine nucleotide-disulphide oxidoreductase [Methylocella silvestris BL2]|uniref:FAD-dependent pyridine nucleotide-disulphide oxidoreductase n=1 Tax=Methylocella silvestris (strain DSM 15510 / CIP 108128 / LMG 27833 / NCIMB 13906 / BL2) TaxID=395965 RepID=B8EQZ7_METSB|nr:FAD/NAD(P)-binding protein [Methylocella silvestris]ACK49742.1 FAD-dependent pyridine nucleotide-disulphide oxidoreductase [Methylocella silvestris BL2]
MSAQSVSAPVAIIGGGFSGATVAFHLLRLRPDLERVVIVEPRADLGRGLAYDSNDPSWRINVPAARMSVSPAEPNHFNDWLTASGRLDEDPAARLPDGRNFPARAVFGEYMGEQLRALGDKIAHVVAAAERVEATPQGYAIACSDGRTVFAKIVVLAVCHPPPSPPALLADAFAGHPHFIENPWAPGALEGIGADARVLIVGTGLTMADIVASLDRLGHRGPITAVSRRGLRSRGHPPANVEPYGEFAAPPARTARELVHRVRQTVAEGAAEGKSWHGALDQVRLQGIAIWRALPLPERARLLRLIRPFWDVHRFRIAPQVEATLDRRIANGGLTLKTASLRRAERKGETMLVTLRSRSGKSSGETETLAFDAVIIATGPAHGGVFTDNRLLQAMRSAGLARPDPLRLGIDVDLDGRAIGADGEAASDLFVAGPLARGTFGELMGLPDVTNYAVSIATHVAERLAPPQASEPDRRKAPASI